MIVICSHYHLYGCSLSNLNFISKDIRIIVTFLQSCNSHHLNKQTNKQTNKIIHTKQNKHCHTEWKQHAFHTPQIHSGYKLQRRGWNIYLWNSTESEHWSFFNHFHVVQAMNCMFHGVSDQFIETFDSLLDVFQIFKIVNIFRILTPSENKIVCALDEWRNEKIHESIKTNKQQISEWMGFWWIN
jgi:hypothetical protein